MCRTLTLCTLGERAPTIAIYICPMLYIQNVVTIMLLPWDRLAIITQELPAVSGGRGCDYLENPNDAIIRLDHPVLASHV